MEAVKSVTVKQGYVRELAERRKGGGGFRWKCIAKRPFSLSRMKW